MTDFSRPTRSALIDRDRGDLNARLPGADLRLRRSAVNALATMHGAALDGAYGYSDFVADQLFPDTADDANVVRIANFWGITPKAATSAAGTALSGASTNGKDIPVGTVAQRGDGQTYVSTADVVVAGGVADVAWSAQTPGLAGDCDPGVILTLVSPIAGVSSTFTVDADGLTGGNDAETTPEIISRVLERVQTPPQSGGPGDYEAWALEVPGVTRAWEFASWSGLGTVGVAFAFDDRPDIFPLVGDVATMQAWLNGLAPITAQAIAFAPTPNAVAFSIALTPSNAQTQAAVAAELADLFSREASPGAGILESHYDQAIGVAAGIADFTVSVPAGDIAGVAGALAVLGAITWL